MSGNANQTFEAACSSDSSIVSRHVGVEATAEEGLDIAASATATDVSSLVPSCAAPLVAHETGLTEFNDNVTRQQPTSGNKFIVFW